jgi:hypothetical protein
MQNKARVPCQWTQASEFQFYASRGAPYLATLTALFSLITVTLIWPG